MKNNILIAVLLLVASCSEGPDAMRTTTGKEGSLMPSFTMRMEDSTKYFFTDRNIKTGSPSFIMYFSPTCPFCRMQTRRITNNKDLLKNVQFVFVTEKNHITELKEFKKEFGMEKLKNFTITIDTGHAFLDYFQPLQYPYTAIYDSNKKLKHTYLGAMSKKNILEGTNM